MRGALRIAKVAGINVYIHWTFSILIFLVILQGIRSGRDTAGIIFILAALLLIFGCIIVHELGHALTALSLNTPVKRVVLLPIGGVTQIESSPDRPLDELLISIAGPLANLGLAILFGLIVFVADRNLFLGFLISPGVMIDSIFLHSPFGQYPALRMLLFLLFANVLLFVFNLIPTFPMDGGRILRATLSLFLPYVRATQLAIAFGQLFAVSLILIAINYRSPGLFFFGLFVILATLPTLLNQQRRRNRFRHHL